ncbi:Nucleoside ABC transporter membrane protein [Lactobacillus equicursoris DSM 19284 = JCM 14600 = CIP 110162]|uniref:ABC transporter permease n=2 Tax=Lactobacillus equicursoris TaxID=420645 RepID=K0NYG4_9LACO|nr:ABC transporter permease [Lactobacillus equicursoris]KRL02314.1 ABC transporter permease [Lactobacillus equicursoris DSM 19284 = JCM 14600 = CIP 110162]MDD6387374.1 ABC transporter permease [Lactobacillus equicursoris]MST80117.1 ABC transporter permease [Lactobacillus equicursoris]CCK84785.1 Nucleoside ABC transporter membrane protein [Lactobacillus equicursoris DSM 19284 = JCM 14600 = CIP 110162]
MIKVSPKAKRLLVPIVSVIAGFLVGAIIMLIWSYDPLQAYSSMFESALGSMNGIGETIRNATPLILIAIGFQISSAAGFFNIGLPGQAQAGWLTAIWIGLAWKNLPVYILLPIEIIAGIIAGALVAGIAGWLRAYFGTNEVISTIMLNYTVLYLCQYLHQDVMSKNLRIDTDTTKSIPANASLRIPSLSAAFGDSRISGGIFLALIGLVIFWFVMKKTTVGFEIKAVGLNPFASRYAGMSDKKNIIVSMLLSGAFCGLGGVIQGLGTYQNYFTQTTTLDIGWDGMSVALLGGMSAIGILLASILFSILKIGGLGMQTLAGIPYEIVSIVIAAIIFFVAISWAVGLLFKEKKTDKTATYLATAETDSRKANSQEGGQA